MTYHGHVRKGRIELDAAVRLPEGTQVELKVIPASGNGGNGQTAPTQGRAFDEELERIWSDVPDAEWDKLPADLTDQLDHYLYGTPKS